MPMKKTAIHSILFISLLLNTCDGNRATIQEPVPDTAIPARALRYHPEQGDFVIVNGKKRFNRALYGTNSGFRVEAGDLPEFAMYLRGMGGNFRLGLVSEDSSLWLIDAEQITARYRPGSMLYEIRDPMLGKGTLHLHVLALADQEGMIIRAGCTELENGVDLVWAYGGANGKRFHREGDLGADPESSFDLKPEYCHGDHFETDVNAFILTFSSVRSGEQERMFGLVPPGEEPVICNAEKQHSPLTLLHSGISKTPVIAGSRNLTAADDLYFILSRERKFSPGNYPETAQIFRKAEQSRKALAGRIRVHTPDDFINTYGAALAIAADAIWEDPSYLHGAVAWRMRLQGWRGAYAGDWLGWHDRAAKHFRGYARAQYTEPDFDTAAPDPVTHLARQKEEKGKSLFTEGYISRRPNEISSPHHYDMNLVLINQLLGHIQWTGDLDFAREMWPVIRRHLEWEKQCFDGNRDGLYDSYASIWASDALQYSGSGVTHSSSCNYRGNLLAAEIARHIGENPEPYRTEAGKIRNAVNRSLWMPVKGWYGEYRDLLGLQRVHPVPAIWTIYHAIDAGISDPFQEWQSLQYVNHHIPHIPIRVKELPGEEYYSLSTTRWMPYEWSINNVALAENLHMALAFWQGGDPEKAFLLWKSQILESMYLGGSPGNFHQLSSLDPFRGELYRDFADPIGMAARTLVEGLFGISPRLVEGRLIIEPGLPGDWEFASLETPDILLDYQQKGKKETYRILNRFPSQPGMVLRIPARCDQIRSLTVNGQQADYHIPENSVGRPVIEILLPPAEQTQVLIRWKGHSPEQPELPPRIVGRERLEMNFQKARIMNVYDPQSILRDEKYPSGSFSATVEGSGHRTFFMQMEQGDLSWWMPVDLQIKKPLEMIPARKQTAESISFRIRNNTAGAIRGEVSLPGKNGFSLPVSLDAGGVSVAVEIPGKYLLPGTNRISFRTGKDEIKQTLVNWEIPASAGVVWRTVDLDASYNDLVTNIFKNEYLSPRCPYPTLQIPWQGIGDWCSYSKTASIDDSGLRKKAGPDHSIELKQGIPMSVPGDPNVPNILFTSLWDNYPDSAIIPLEGRASHAYLLMAGSTHHMQSRIANGEVRIHYTDGTFETLELINPVTWWPIEQDYYVDEYAFRIEATRPPRLHLKTGEVPETPYRVLARNKTNLIDGGAATLLDVPLDPARELESLHLRTLSNDVVIGLMAVTLAGEE